VLKAVLIIKAESREHVMDRFGFDVQLGADDHV
jgi:hypothetical protein